MKKLLSISGLLVSTNSFAHVSQAGHSQHASEHLLLAALLIPAVWLIARKVFK